MTYAEQQFAFWETARDHGLAWGDLGEASAGKASKIVDAIDAYQPLDFQPGASWEGLETAWIEAPKSYARTQALAAIVLIRRAIGEYV